MSSDIYNRNYVNDNYTNEYQDEKDLVVYENSSSREISASERIENASVELSNAVTKVSEDIVVFKEIATQLISYKNNIAQMHSVLMAMDMQNQNNLQRMEISYQIRKPELDDTREQISKIMQKLDEMDLSTMSEAGHKTYRVLVKQATDLRNHILQIYEQIF